MTATTITGTTGNDILSSPGSVLGTKPSPALIVGFQGDDTITISQASDSASAGQGNDSINILFRGSQVATIDSGAGDDTISSKNGASYSNQIYAGDGADSIIVGSPSSTGLVKGSTIFGGGGNDTIDLGTATRTVINSFFGLGSGDDSIHAPATTLFDSQIYGAKGKDTIAIGAEQILADVNINAGLGADLITFEGGASVTNTYIGAGKGADSIHLGTASFIAASIAGGGLSDTITIEPSTNYYEDKFARGGGVKIYGDAFGVTTAGTGLGGGADGADIIGGSAQDFGNASIYGAGGADTIKVFGCSALVFGGNGHDVIHIYGQTLNSVNGGSGDDIIKHFNPHTGSPLLTGIPTLNGGAGNDSLIYGGTTANFLSTGALNATGSRPWYHGGYSNFIVEGAVSGDKIIADSTALDVSNSNFNSTSGTIYVYATASASVTELEDIEGSMGIYSDGNDTYFTIASGGSKYAVFNIRGTDLVTTTKLSQDIAVTTLNFGFSVTANSNDTGIIITLV
ncbi:calcium-binding protein [cyanobiont of Ornithocercus magnificus]|nr:calcium-binding protein [cyanobiont of Ornithocercus magnificus]